jgi:SAM-dependent methyltransferase
MLGFERDVADLYAGILAHDPVGTNDQLLSLTAANQYRTLYALTAKYVLPGAAVLDWGCGRGHFSYFLVRRGFTVTAYSLQDPPEIFGALAPSLRGRLSFVQGASDDPVSLPFPSRSFAAVFSVGVLEHVRETGGDELRSLGEIRRVLARDGVLICYHVPNRYSYIEALSRALYGRRYGHLPQTVKFHKYSFTARDLKALCRAAGLSLIERRRYGFVPRNSFNRLPRGLRSSRLLASAVNVADVVLERVFVPFVQNHYFVARPEPVREA